MDCVVVFPNVDVCSLICVGRFVSNVTFELCLQNCLYILTLSFVFVVLCVNKFVFEIYDDNVYLSSYSYYWHFS